MSRKPEKTVYYKGFKLESYAGGKYIKVYKRLEYVRGYWFVWGYDSMKEARQEINQWMEARA